MIRIKIALESAIIFKSIAPLEVFLVFIQTLLETKEFTDETGISFSLSFSFTVISPRLIRRPYFRTRNIIFEARFLWFMASYRTRNTTFDFEARLFYFMAYRKRNVVFGER